MCYKMLIHFMLYIVFYLLQMLAIVVMHVVYILKETLK